jgi:CheY-like chemotaxis protein
VKFAVRDTGMGIPPDRLDRLFKSFSQVDATIARSFGGTGLGLAIARSLAELMGGQSWVESKPGQGSTFYFTIAAASVELYPRYSVNDHANLRGLRLLAVDDNATNRHILSGVASSWGMVVRDTALPRTALAWIDAGETFDLAVLDQLMPEMDGTTLAREIHGRAGSAGLPLIMASSVGRTSATNDFAASLTKPIRRSELHDLFMEIAGRRLPLARQEPGDVPPVRVLGASPLVASGLRILLAEDNAINQKIARFQLESLGYRADVVGDGAAVIRALEQRSYDVILMDVQMPVMDGFTTTRAITARWPRESRPWIIAMTANALSGDREQCLQTGMDDYLAKPVAREHLARALHAVAAVLAVRSAGEITYSCREIGAPRRRSRTCGRPKSVHV